MAGQTLIAYRKCSLALSILHNNVTCLAFVSSHQTSIWMPLILKPLACNIILANRSRCWTEWTENQIRASFRNGCKCLIQESIGIARHIEMQDLTPIVADDEKAVQNTKSERWDGEKVHRSNGLAMVSEERQPSLHRVWISRGSPHPSRDTPFREIETQLAQFAVNTRCSPGWILSNHTEDQGANLFADTLLSSYLAESGDPRPIQTKSRSLPVYDGSSLSLRNSTEKFCSDLIH